MKCRKISILCLVVSILFSFLPTNLVWAEGLIKVEGEKYKSASMVPAIVSDATLFSEGKAIQVLGDFGAGAKIEFEYIVNVPVAGAYKLYQTACTASGAFAPSNSKYSVQINNETPIPTRDRAVNIEWKQNPWGDGMFYKQDMQYVILKQGENSIKYIVTDPRWGNNYFFALDCFELEYTPFDIYQLSAKGPKNVYEKQSDVIFDITFNCNAPAEKTYSFEIKDVWTNYVLNGKFTIEKGKNLFSLNLGRFEPGWYSLNILDGTEFKIKTAFSIVPPLAERKNVSGTPFATDFASDWLVTTNTEDIANYAKAAKLAGVEWVRERYRWGDIEPEKGKYTYNRTERTVNVISKEGLKILNTFHDVPAWAKNPRGELGADLFDIYNMQKATADYFNGKVQAWEVCNEVDSAYASEGADYYTAFFKAAALGLADSKAKPIKSFAGFAYGPDVPYMDLCMQNGMMEYSDVYNNHCHNIYNGDSVQHIGMNHLKAHGDVNYSYGMPNQPIWITEAGLGMPMRGDAKTLSREQMLSQARYVVTSFIESLSVGTTRQFWFIWSSYLEAGVEWGAFSKDGYPMPSYSAYANMTNVLGQGKYKGKFDNLLQGVNGYLIDSGTEDVGVFWSDNPTKVQFETDKAVTLTDFMGSKKVIKPCRGRVNIPVYNYPVFVTFADRIDVKNYFPSSFEANQETVHEFTDVEKIVMFQNFPDENYKTPKVDGYILNADKKNTMKLEVYNFSDKEMKGTITGKDEAGFSVIPPQQSVTVAPKGKTVLDFEIKGYAGATYGITHFLKFDGLFNNEQTSPSVSRIIMNEQSIVTPDGLMPGGAEASKWDVRNIAAGAVATVKAGDEPGTLTFTPDFNGGDRWFYPWLGVSNNNILKTTTGLCFWVYCEEQIDGSTGMNVMLNLSDGRRYFLGDNSRIQMKKGWNQIQTPWRKFILQYSPGGYADIRPFDIMKVNSVSIGLNTQKDVPFSYTIKEFGYYTLENDPQAIKKEITVTGITDNGVYEEGTPLNVLASLPENTKLKRVLIQNTEYTGYTVNGQNVNIDLSNLKKGSYRLLIVAESEMNFAYRKEIAFDIKGA